ncbi:disease resistance TIR-NBS-LRR class family protein, partial [Tanacetum coccineum]
MDRTCQVLVPLEVNVFVIVLSAGEISEDGVSNWNYDNVSLYRPNALRFLRLEGYPFTCLPKTFPVKVLRKLRLLKIYESEYLKTLDITFRGEDTRHSFVSHLYKALEQNGIQTYKDDEEIEKGEMIDTQLIESIEDSRFFIIPTKLRKQSGAVEKAFKKHENKEVAGKWRKALNEAANLAGCLLSCQHVLGTLNKTASLGFGIVHVEYFIPKGIFLLITTNFDESKLIEIIVDDIFQKICSTGSSVDGNLVGMETRIEALLSSLELDAPGVRMIGIWGMGGGGKTTLATTIFNQICHEFEGSSFVDNVREVSKNSLSGLKKLQKQILKDIFNDQDITVSSVSGGKNKMEQMMRLKKVLVVLDDVDSTNQLEALAGWRKDDAVIALKSCGFFAEAALRVLEQKSLITIFEDYRLRLGMHDHIEELGKNIVRRLNPNEPKRHSRLWIDEEIEEILTNDSGTQETKCIKMFAEESNFEILMKGLANMKELRFLQVGCRYVSEEEVSNWNFDEVSNWNLPNALRFLSWYGYPFSSLPKTFQAKNLVGLDMHYNNMVQLWKDGEEKAFLKLRFLNFYYTSMRTLDLSVAPNLETLILDTCDNLVELDFQVTPNLKELRIHHCNRLEKVHMPAQSPNLETLILELCYYLEEFRFQVTPNLKELRIHECIRLEKLHMPAESPKLRSLYLYIIKLRTLHLGITRNLETLLLRNCNHLVEVHFQVNLKELRISSCERLEKLHMFAECSKLVNLELCNLNLRTLHLGVTPNLETVSLKECHDLVELQIPVECSKLVTLDLNYNAKLRTLDLGVTPNLESLDLKNCYDLEEINAPAECLKKLLHLDISHCGRFKSLEFDKKRDSREVVSLSELHLNVDADLIADTGIFDPHNTWSEFQFSCYYKEDSASSFGNLESLISLGSDARINVDYFSDIICGLQCLRKLTLEGGIPEAPKNLDRLDCLKELSLRSTDIKTLPDSICMLKHLKSLKLESCLLLEKLPVDIGRLECLESLILYECTLLQDLPNSICEMKCLICLELTRCIQVEKLPEEIGLLECLKELNIKCTGISHLPRSIHRLKGLRIVGDRGLLKSTGSCLFKIRRTSDDED